MKSLMNFFKTTLIGGLLVVLPVWVCLLLVLQVVSFLQGAVSPISDQLPASLGYPRIIAAAGLLAICFGVGLAVKTAIGRRTKTLVERHLLEKIPGYAMLRGVTEQLAAFKADRGFRSALAVIEDALVPAFIVEQHADGRYTVFVPSAPTPATGAIYILPAARVHPLAVPLMTTMQCVSQWGMGSGELLAAMKPSTVPAPAVGDSSRLGGTAEPMQGG